MPETALFVVDIQHELASDPKTQIPAAQRIRDAGISILEKSRDSIRKSIEAGEKPPLTIVFVQHEESPDDGTLNNGTKAWELVFPLNSDSKYERLVAKTTNDTFESNSSLAAELKQAGVRDIVIFGIQSEYCVRATSRGALAAGFHVTLLSGAHSTYDTKDQSAVQIEREVEEQLRHEGARILEWPTW